MRYQKPGLRSLSSNRDATGNCGNGTGATTIIDECIAGVGINGWIGGKYCWNGSGDMEYCYFGQCANDGSAQCLAGDSPNSACGTGGAVVA